MLSYGPTADDVRSRADRLFVYLDRLLRGGSPDELPVIQPSRYELVINMRTAKALGLTIPRPLRQRADELIE